MAWLLLIVAWVWCKELQAARDLRAIQKLQRRFGAPPLAREAPSPHQLLGEVARPLAPRRQRRGLLRALRVRVTSAAG